MTDQVRRKPEREHPLEAPPPRQRGRDRRDQDGKDDLREEHCPVLGLTKAISLRIGQDGARGGKSHQRQPLDEAGQVDQADFVSARRAGVP